MSLQKPTLALVKDPAQLLQILLSLYDQAVEQAQPQLPDYVPALKSVTMSSFSEMRKLRGDAAGKLGPRACIVTGKATVFDGFEGLFGWDPNSTATDDEANTIQVPNVTPGRWVRMLP